MFGHLWIETLDYRFLSTNVREVILNGTALQLIRERTGLSQSDLSRRTTPRVSQGRISEIEAKSLNVRPATAKALADALGVPLGALILPEPDSVAS